MARLFERLWADGARTLVMGVVNVTPDSFSDGGCHADVASAVAHAARLFAEGADLLDVGGESTRPGAAPVDAAEELDRVLPVVAALAPLGVPLSIDTYKAEVAEAALVKGAALINDISGGALDPGILSVAARHGAPIVLGHLRGTPATMMDHIAFADVVAEVGDELAGRVRAAQQAGVHEIWVDPGLGFGKGTRENLALLGGLGTLGARLGRPLVVGASRKRFLGELTGLPAAERAAPSAVAAALSGFLGAHVVRVHDVAVTRQALAVADAVRRAR